MSVCFVLEFTVCVTCGNVNKKIMHFFIWFVTIMGVRVCTGTECGQGVCVSVSVPRCFRQVSTCVQLLSPLIFCLVSVLSGICA